MIKRFFGALVVLALVSSCIPNERVVYLQNADNLTELGLDTLIALERQDYRLQPNDILIINFYSEQKQAVEKFNPAAQTSLDFAGAQGIQNQQGAYFTGFNIDKEGNIEVTALGRVKASGLTTFELKYKLEDLIKEKEGVNDILVNVKLDGIRYTIFGEVTAPGPQTLRRYEANVIEAIATSGDLTLNANRRQIQLIRQYPEGRRFHEIDVTDRALMQSKYFFLQPNDIIYVPPLKIRELGTGQTGLETFASIVSVVSGLFLIVNLVNN